MPQLMGHTMFLILDDHILCRPSELTSVSIQAYNVQVVVCCLSLVVKLIHKVQLTRRRVEDLLSHANDIKTGASQRCRISHDPAVGLFCICGRA